MANVSLENVGPSSHEPVWGDAFIDYDFGKEPENDLYLEVAADTNIITPEELSHYIDHCANKDVELNRITFPPDPEVTLRLATEFYDTYLSDTDIDKVEAIDRYCVTLIDKVVAQAKKDAEENPELAPVIEEALVEFDDEVEEYVQLIHATAEAEHKELALAA